MKTITKTLIIFLSLIVCFLLQECAKKESVEFDMMKKELVILDKGWGTAGENLRITMAKMNFNLEEIGKLESSFSKLKMVKSPQAQKEISMALNSTIIYHDSLRTEMKELNNYIHEWNAKSGTLNELIGLVESKSVSSNEALVRIDELKKFKAQADKNLIEITAHLATYEAKCNELSKTLGKYKK